jgi:hypothetical protein
MQTPMRRAGRRETTRMRWRVRSGGETRRITLPPINPHLVREPRFAKCARSIAWVKGRVQRSSESMPIPAQQRDRKCDSVGNFEGLAKEAVGK